MKNTVNRVFLTGKAVSQPEYYLSKGIGATTFTLMTIETLAKGILHEEFHNIVITSLSHIQVLKVTMGSYYQLEGKIVTSKKIDASGTSLYVVSIEVSNIQLLTLQ